MASLFEGRRLLLCYLYGIAGLFMMSYMLYYYKATLTVTMVQKRTEANCSTNVHGNGRQCPECPECSPLPVCQTCNATLNRVRTDLDYSRCALNKPFLVYIYYTEFPDYPPSVLGKLTPTLQRLHSWTENPSEACLFLVPISSGQMAISATELEQKLHSLSHWNILQHGANHVLVDLSTPQHTSTLLGGIDTGAAVIVSGYTAPRQYLYPLHLLAPPIIPPDAMKVSVSLHDPISLFSVEREHRLYFEGNYKSTQNPNSSPLGDLSKLQLDSDDVMTDCSKSEGSVPGALEGEWALCGSVESRISRCGRSIFSLVLGGTHDVMGAATYTRLIESLRCGSVPVIVGIGRLPFDQVINWRKASIVIPHAHLQTVLDIIATIRTREIVGYRKQGRFLLDTYFSSQTKYLETVIAILRSKTMHPPPPIPDFSATILVRKGADSRFPPALRFQNNFSIYTEDLWNSPPGPFYMYPVTPFRYPYHPRMTSKPLGNKQPGKGVNHHGEGLVGANFKKELYGNSPEEGFTLLMLTYKRSEQLLRIISQYRGCPYLAKVLVIWNNEREPPNDLAWPDIGVPIEVVRTGHNNLNNRFLPFESIQTDAVLSLDDDEEVPHLAIEFAFRVWREHRDALVGWITRFHEWQDNRWVYRTGATCQPSLALTGAVFFHKYYSYLYSYWMPRSIRDVVNHYMSGEDIAMNFLVAHIAGRPPVKVDSHPAFDCKNCSSGLHTTKDYFDHRDDCVNMFTKAWGYNPLLYTQTRVEPVFGDGRCFPAI